MFSKIVLNCCLILLMLTNVSMSAETGGMPQLDTEFWISQIFWLLITFGLLFVTLSKFILPNISANLESRKSQILDNLEIADKQREESENKIKKFDKIIIESKNEAKNIINDAKRKLIEDINKKKEALETEINTEIMNAEKEISDLVKKSPEKINQIAIETSSGLIKQLINADVNKSNISAIVEDLSKRSKEKYHGV